MTHITSVPEALKLLKNKGGQRPERAMKDHSAYKVMIEGFEQAGPLAWKLDLVLRGLMLGRAGALRKTPMFKVDKNGCWLWLLSVTSGGYGQIMVDQKTLRVHRFVYENVVGPIESETLDHLCKVRSCANPDHLDPVSLKENLLRGDGGPARNARKTRCKNGHALSGENLVIQTYRGHKRRQCRKCMKVRSDAKNARLNPIRRLKNGN